MRNQWVLLILSIVVARPCSIAAEESGSGVTSVEAMVCRRYHHGIPYVEANSIDPAVMPRLRKVLTDPSKKGCWENAIVVIAAIGSPESYGFLRSFVWDRFKGPVDAPTYSALEAAVATVGFSSLGQPTLVVEYLEKGADPKYWTSLPWYYPEVDRARTERVFSRFSVHGLGHCSNPKARSALLRLEKRPYYDAQLADIRSSLVMQEEVARIGLRAYQTKKSR